MKLFIKKMGINGEGIGYYKRKPVFVDGAFPEETVDVEITETNDRYSRGVVKKVLDASQYRLVSPCPYDEKCGGCSLMSLDYPAQLKYKKELLKEAFLKYSELKPIIKDMIGADKTQHYRNKCSLPIVEKEGKLYNALYRPSTNKPVIIHSCLIHDETTERVRKKVMEVLNRHELKAYELSKKKGIRHLMIRSLGGQTQVVLVTGHDEISSEVINDIMNIETVVSLYQGINVSRKAVNQVPDKLKLLKGESEITFDICGLKVRLLPQAFFQLNEAQTVKLYELVRKLAQKSGKTVVEAFSGVGIMSLMLADGFEKVIGIEIVPEAVKNARKMAEDNEKKNLEFITGDVNKVIYDITLNRQIDVLIVDPPRTGLEDETLQVLNKADIKTIIYVSCNPATLAKNIMKLSEKYSVKEAYPLDMFPNTAHVECVTLMTRK